MRLRHAVLRNARRLYHAMQPCMRRLPWIERSLAAWRGNFRITYPESRLAHRYLDGLKGIEIGAGAFNPFGLDTFNVNYTAGDDTPFGQAEHARASGRVPVDVVAMGDRLPFADASVDFLLASHVLEHFIDPIAAMREWSRIVRKGGTLFLILPHKERTFDRDRPRTTLDELLAREGRPNLPSVEHHNVWVTEDLLELCRHLQLDVLEFQDRDDKVGNGFTLVIGV